MTLENKNLQKEQEMSKTGEEKELGIEQAFDHSQAILEAKKIKEEIVNHCEEMVVRLKDEGTNVGISKKDFENFENQIVEIYKELEKIIKEYEKDIEKDEKQMKLAESLSLETINADEIKEKIKEKKGGKEQISKFADESRNSYSKVENAKREKERLKLEKETNRKNATAEIEQVIVGAMYSEKNYRDFHDLQSKESSIFELNKRVYSSLKNTLLETQPGVVKEAVDQKIKENPEIEEKLKINKEKPDLSGLNKEQKAEIEEKLAKKEEREKNQEIFNADIFLKLIREGKIDVEKLCESVADGIKVLDTDYIDNAKENKNDAIFLPSMVLEKIFEKMKDEEIFELVGREAENLEKTMAIKDWHNSGFKKFQEYKAKSDLCFNLKNHPEFIKRYKKITDDKENRVWDKERTYIANHFDKNVAEFSKILEDLRIGNATRIVRDNLSDKKQNAVEEIKIREKADVIKSELQKISEKRKDLFKRLQEEKEKIQEYRKDYDSAIKNKQFVVALEILDKVEKFNQEALSKENLEKELKKLEEEEKEQKELRNKNKIEPSIKSIERHDEYDNWMNEKELDKKIKGGFSDLAVEITQKAKRFNQEATKEEMGKINSLVLKDEESKEYKNKKEKEEMIDMAKNNGYSRYHLIEEKQKNRVYNSATEALKEEISLPDIKWDYYGFQKILDDIYDKNFREEHEEGAILKGWLEDKKNNPTGFGLLGVKINNPLENNKESRFRKDSLNALREQIQKKFNGISENLKRKRAEVKKIVFAEMKKNHYDKLAPKLQESKQKREKFLSQFEEKYSKGIQLIKDKFVKDASSRSYVDKNNIYGTERIDKWLEFSDREISSDKIAQEDFEQQWKENFGTFRSSRYEVLVEDDFKKRVN